MENNIDVFNKLKEKDPLGHAEILQSLALTKEGFKKPLNEEELQEYYHSLEIIKNNPSKYSLKTILAIKRDIKENQFEEHQGKLQVNTKGEIEELE